MWRDNPTWGSPRIRDELAKLDIHVSDSTISAFLRERDKEQTVIVYCYHGHASMGGAAFLMEHGFLDVFSMRGGFEAWRGTHPHESA